MQALLKLGALDALRKLTEGQGVGAAHMASLSLLQGLADACDDLETMRECIRCLRAYKVIALLQQASPL